MTLRAQAGDYLASRQRLGRKVGKWVGLGWLALLIAQVVFSSCGSPPVVIPTPPPTTLAPSPSPEPLAPFDPPLSAIGTKVVDASGRDAELVYVIGCCSDPAWPLVSHDLMVRASAAGANGTHIRVGPFWKFGWVGSDFIAGDETYRQYMDVGGRADLARWNDFYFTRLRSILGDARALRLYVEVDLVDGWTLERPAAHPWAHGNNIQGFDGGDCSILAKAPHGWAQAFVRKMVQETGEFTNVVYEIGNETGICNGRAASFAWEKGIVDAVRAEEALQGFIRHVVVSNNDPFPFDPSYAEIEAYHGPDVLLPGLRPREVNEYNPGLTPETFRANLERARLNGTYFHLWFADLDSVSINRSLDEITAYRKEQ